MRKSADGVPTRSSRLVAKLFLVLLLMAGAAAAMYFWQQSSLKDERREARIVEAALRSQIAEQQREIDAGWQAASENDEAILNEEAAQDILNNASWQDLGRYFATDKIEITLAASEGLGERTSDQVAEDLKLLESASSSWQVVDRETLQEYRMGDYAQYFSGEDQLVFRSSDGHVVSFMLSANGRLAGIFITSSEDLL